MIKLICAVLFLSIPGVSMAADWYADPAGSDDPNGSSESPFATIQEALDEAQSGDRIILKPGVYTGPGNSNLNPGGRILTIQSIRPEDFDIIETTVIDPNGLGRGFVFQTNEDPNFILSGITIRNTWSDQNDDPPHGSAVFCSGASPTIRYCIFQNCDADGGWGGAFYGEFSRAAFEHCLFIGNKARYGGALAVNLDSQITLDHCTISGNTAWFNGGGLICDFDSTVTITNSILYFNRLQETQRKGWQVSLRSSSLTASFSDISNLPDDLEADSKSLLIYREGVIHADPNFVFYDPAASPEQLDLHLKSRYGRWDRSSSSWIQDSVTSPCIDAGDPNSVWTAEPWPNGKRVNMGFYGGTYRSSMYGNPADFTVNGIVDLDDFSELADLWLSDLLSGIHDLDGDRRIDLSDFYLFSRQWLWTN